jgi:hypothetical protein
MVLIVLMAFALGRVVGVLGMVPRWWRQRQAANSAQASQNSQSPNKSENQPDSGTATTLSEAGHGT